MNSPIRAVNSQTRVVLDSQEERFERSQSKLRRPDRKSSRIAWIIAATSFAFVVVQLDVTIVNVALPRIGADLGATVTELQWVVDAYTLSFAALLLSAGAIGDRFGPKRVFVSGFLVFAVSSLACGLAANAPFLIATRVVQGLGAALLVPNSLALLNDACGHDSRLRARAIGFWTAAGGVSIAAGPVVGGVLLAGFGWRSIFLVNLPICAYGLALTLRQVSEMRRHIRSFDLAGQLLAIAALASLVGAMIEVRPLGISHPLVVGGFVTGLIAAGVFIAVESRIVAPMLPLHFFRRPGFAPAILFGVLVSFCYYGLIFLLSLYLQKVLGYSTFQAGLAFIPLTGTFILSNIASGWIAGRTGSRVPMMLGGIIGSLGFALLYRLGAQSTFIDMLPGFVLVPIGLGLAVPAMTAAVLSTVDHAWSGTASAALNAARQAGGATGVAALGALAGAGTRAEIVSGLKTGTLTATGLIIIATVIAHWVRPRMERSA